MSPVGRPAGEPDLDGLLQAWSLWSGPPERTGDAWRVPAGPLTLALDDALWTPAPSALARARAGGDDVLIAPGAPAEDAARAAGYRAWLAVRADDPFAGPSADSATARVDVADAAPRRWDVARSVAELLLAAEPDGHAGEPAEAEARAGAIAAALAAAAEEDAGISLHLTGERTDQRAAAVSARSANAVVIVAGGGAVGPLAARLLDDARSLGLRTYWTRTCDLDDPAAWLRRWTRDA